METVQRIEIVTDSAGTPDVVSALAAAGAHGWSIIPNVAGSGHRGRRDANWPMDAGSNVMFLIAADKQVAESIVNTVRPLLAKWGGMCLVSEAAWVGHGKGTWGSDE